MSVVRESDTGRPDTVTLGQITTQWSYTPFDEPHKLTTSLSTAEGPEVLYEETFTYDKRGWIIDLIRTQSGATVTESFGYDNRGRLETVKHDGVPFASYGYDANSNRTSYDGTFGTVTSTVYDERDRLLQYGDKTYTYNDAGELESKSQNGESVTYDYDVFGNLRQVVLPAGTTIDYVIDGAQRRIGKKVDGQLTRAWLYQDSLDPIAELSATGAVVSRFVYGTRPNVPDSLIKDGVTYRIIADHLGSPRLVIDASTGTIVQELRYDEFGRITLDTNPDFQPFGFAGGLYDYQTGLVRFGARDYDPEVGRWAAKDESLFRGRQLNLYLYAAGDPVNLADQNGFDTIFVHYDFYPISVELLGRELPLGHAGVVAVNPKTGTTRYYEFGRYPVGPFEKSDGNVRRQPIPNLAIGKDGKPTEESMNRLLGTLSKKYGKDKNVSYRYFPDRDHQAAINYAEQFQKSHDPYHPITNSCKTFAADAALACEEGDENCPYN